MPKVNIIIPIHNRWDHTKQTLDSLIENTDKKLYSLHLVDDFSDFEVKKKILNYFKEHSYYIDTSTVNIHNIGPGASRNKTCDMLTEKGLRGQYLYHSDNDVYFTKGWLEKLLNCYIILNESSPHKKKIKIFGGSCHPYLKNNSVIDGEYRGEFVRLGIKDAVSGYSQLMTWETWDKYGPFDETMRGAKEKIMGSEDWAFCQKIIKDGGLVGSIEPEVVIPCGKTNTYGKLATGSETFKNHEGVNVM